MMNNDPSQILMMVLGSLSRQVPILIVWGIVFVVALLKSSTYPRASMLTIVAVIVAFGTSCLASIAYPLLPRMMDTTDISWMYFGLSVFLSILHGLSWLLLLGAVYSGRQPEISHAAGYGKKPLAG